MEAAQGTRGVLDTSTIILIPRIGDARMLPAEPFITAVTLAELSVGPLVARTDQERASRQAILQQAEADFDPIAFDAAAASGWVAQKLNLGNLNTPRSNFKRWQLRHHALA